MFILSDQIIICFQLIPFLENSLFSVHITNITGKTTMRVSLSFASTMPNVGSKYSKFGFEKKKKLLTVGFLGSISQTRRKCIYERWTTGAGWWEALKLFYCKHVLAILKTCSTRLELGNYSRTYRNNAILSFDFSICQSEQFTMAIRLIFTHLIQMITDIHIYTLFINENIWIQ